MFRLVRYVATIGWKALRRRYSLKICCQRSALKMTASFAIALEGHRTNLVKDILFLIVALKPVWYVSRAAFRLVETTMKLCVVIVRVVFTV